MKKILLITITLFLTLSVKSQVPVAFLNEPPSNGYTEELVKTILNNKYLTESYDSGYIDNYKKLASLRYNIYNDEMEFEKDGTIYFLKKEVGRKVQFSNLSKDLYKVYTLNGKAQFFLVHTEEKNSLLAKQSVKFVSSKKARTTYDNSSLADFKRKKDVLYLAKNNKDLVKIPTNKKKFYNLFGDKSSEIKNYIIKNKLGIKEINDLKQIITYYNAL